MDVHQTIVTAALTAKSSAETPRKPRSEARGGAMSPASALVIFIMATPPHSGLVASQGSAVEPLIHAPKAIQSSGIGGVGVVYRSILPNERAHARPFAGVGEHVGSRHRRVVGDRSLAPLGSPLPFPRLLPSERAGSVDCRLAAVVVFDASLTLLFLAEADGEVGVEVTAERRCPGEGPAHPFLVGLNLRERRPRDGPEYHVVVRQVDGERVESVRNRRAGGTPGCVVRPEHVVVNEKL